MAVFMVDQLVNAGTKIEGLVKRIEVGRQDINEAKAALREQNLNEYTMAKKEKEIDKEALPRLKPIFEEVSPLVAEVEESAEFFSPAGRRTFALHHQAPERTAATAAVVALQAPDGLLRLAKLAQASGDIATAQMVFDAAVSRGLKGDVLRAIGETVEATPIPRMEETQAALSYIRQLGFRAKLALLGDTDPVKKLVLGRMAARG